MQNAWLGHHFLHFHLHVNLSVCLFLRCHLSAVLPCKCGTLCYKYSTTKLIGHFAVSLVKQLAGGTSPRHAFGWALSPSRAGAEAHSERVRGAVGMPGIRVSTGILLGRSPLAKHLTDILIFCLTFWFWFDFLIFDWFCGGKLENKTYFNLFFFMMECTMLSCS